MDLDAFLPYQLAVLAEAVSRSMSQIYAQRFDLSRDEWRVLAALHDAPPTRTASVIEQTTLDKVSVSRALRRMEDKALVERMTDPQDARGYLIRLTPAGRSLFRKIVPMVQAREQFLLDGLGASERMALQSAMQTLLNRARQLTQQG
ncbi:MAG: MarR family transcriptional regulator [Betaproteobacteria bacterium]|nr:MarR family transcriptional regulator [Betaproteobacteria bacterium]MBP7780392.1 MarR family transcriptional regulator [Burkholderiaceae bacterium]